MRSQVEAACCLFLTLPLLLPSLHDNANIDASPPVGHVEKDFFDLLCFKHCSNDNNNYCSTETML